MIKIPELKKFKKSTEVVASHSWGDDYDIVFRASSKSAIFEIWHEEEQYGNDTWGWQARIILHKKDNDDYHHCASKCSGYEEAYQKMLSYANTDSIFPAPHTKKQLDISKRIKETEEKYQVYSSKHSVQTFKSEFVGCKKCGSKLKRELLFSEFCPLCKTDLRSKTTVDTLQRYKAKIKQLTKELQASY